MNSEYRELYEDLLRTKYENPKWFEVLRLAAKLPDDELRQLREAVEALTENK